MKLTEPLHPQALGQALRTSHTTLPSRGFQPGHSRETGLGKRSCIHKKGTLKEKGARVLSAERVSKGKEAGNKNWGNSQAGVWGQESPGADGVSQACKGSDY